MTRGFASADNYEDMASTPAFFITTYYPNDGYYYLRNSNGADTPFYLSRLRHAADFLFLHGWGLRRALTDKERICRADAEHIRSRTLDLKPMYKSPITFRLQKIAKRYSIRQPCWRSGRWKSLT